MILSESWGDLEGRARTNPVQPPYRTTPMLQRLVRAGLGVLATLVGVAAGHLVAAVTDPAASPVLAVGSAVVDRTPTPLKEWAIAHFGTHDKDILVGSVMLGVLLLAAVAGLLTRLRFWYGAALLVLLTVIPAVVATNPLPSIVAAVTGVAALAWLTHPSRPDEDAARGDASGRRGLLIASGSLAVAAVAMGGAGRWITSYRTRTTVVDLPAAADPAPAFPTGLDSRIPGITSFRTPVSDFYRVDTRLVLPIVDVDSWTLTIDGDVGKKVTFTFDDLMQMPLIERDITMTCVSNDVGGKYVGSARWLGVRLQDLLDQADISATKADQILSTDVDGMTISTPLDVATDGRDAMIAIGMNGTSLAQEHGFPARMVVPGLYGFVSACKWITRMTLTTYEAQDAYWTKRDWATDAPIKIASRVDTPKPLATVDVGRVVIGGIAWAQHQGGVAKVEVKVDDGEWQQARLGPSAGSDYWRQWYLPWTAEPGQHSIASRATAGDGDVQVTERAAPFPDGSSGIQQIIVNVA